MTIIVRFRLVEALKSPPESIFNEKCEQHTNCPRVSRDSSRWWRLWIFFCDFMRLRVKEFASKVRSFPPSRSAAIWWNDNFLSRLLSGCCVRTDSFSSIVIDSGKLKFHDSVFLHELACASSSPHQVQFLNAVFFTRSLCRRSMECAHILSSVCVSFTSRSDISSNFHGTSVSQHFAVTRKMADLVFFLHTQLFRLC